MLAFSPEPPTWEQFKVFLYKKLGDFWVFVDSIWRKIKKVAQYQLERVWDFTAHLKYLHSVPLEFDDDSPDEFYLIWFFCNDFRPSIKIQMENNGLELHN